MGSLIAIPSASGGWKGTAPDIRQEGETHMDATALVIFTDIRGFTGWARDTEVFASLESFVNKFLGLVAKHFKQSFVKGLGDGAMIVREIDPATKAAAYSAILAETLETIGAVEHDFDQ